MNNVRCMESIVYHGKGDGFYSSAYFASTMQILSHFDIVDVIGIFDVIVD